MRRIIVRGLNSSLSIAAALDAAADADLSREAAEAARDAAEALIVSDLGTTDGQTRALIEAPASQTAQALSATIAEQGGEIVGEAAGPAFVPGSPFIQRNPKAKISAMARFHTKLGSRNTSPCAWVQIGDSITEGEGATSREFRWASRSRDLLRSEHPTRGVAGGDNYQTAMPTIATYPKDPVGANMFDNILGGFGRRGKQLNKGNPLVFTVCATSVKIAYFRDTGTGAFTYTLDGGSPVTVPTSGSQADGYTHQITGLGGTVHTLSIDLDVPGQFCVIEGVYVYNGDETRGVQVYESGHYNWRTSDFLTGTLPDAWYAHVTNVQPALVTIALGANDAVTDSAATYKANTLTLIGKVRAAITTPPSIALVLYPARNNTLAEPWANYVTAAKQIATADAAIDVLDLSALLPAVANAPTGYWADSVHPANKAHALIARAVVDFITP